jgi:DNA-binding PadR family transcriptional regulator
VHIKKWFPIAASSIYAAIKTLDQRGYIQGTPLKEGNMPEKTIYSATEKGKSELHLTLTSYLASTDLDSVQFNIALLLVCHIPKSEVLQILNMRFSKLDRLCSGITHQITHLEANHLPALGLMTIKHNLYLLEAEITLTKELLSEIEASTTWNNFLAIDAHV